MSSESSNPTPITLPGAGNEPNQWLCFRRRLVLEAVSASVLVRIAVDSKYWLWVNGALVLREGSLKRTAGPARTYEDTVDLHPYLRPGENTVALLVWYFGRNGISHHSCARPAFSLVSSDCPALESSSAWKVARHGAFSTCEALQPNYRLPESSVCFDAEQEPQGWTEREYDDHAWAAAEPVAPEVLGEFVPRAAPHFWFGERRSFTAVRREGSKLIGTLPWNQQFTTYLRMRAPAGQIVDFLTDTHAVDGKRHHQSVATRYRTREGEQEFETFAWMSGHEAHFILGDEIEVCEIGYRPTAFAHDESGTFFCEDPMLNRLWEKCRRTLSVCLRDGYMDCPDRERGLYLGDAVNAIAQTFYAFGESGRAHGVKTLREVCAWQRTDGAIYAPIGGDWAEELGPQSLLFAGFYGAWQIYLHTADRALLDETFPALRRFVDLWQIDPKTGLANYRGGDWNWTDWGEGIDESVIQNAMLALAYRGLGAMARERRDDPLAESYAQSEASLKKSLHAAFYDGKLYRSEGFEGPADDRAIAMVVLAGAAPPEAYPELSAYLDRHRSASPYMERFVLEALFQMGQGAVAMHRLRERYAAWIESPCTTLPEQWELPPGTVNHAWSGAPLQLLPQYLLGVAPLAPGFRRFTVRPDLCGLSKLTAQVPTPHGIIRVNSSHEQWQYLLEVVVPVGTVAEVFLPSAMVKERIKVNGRRYYSTRGGGLQMLDGVELKGHDASFFAFVCQSGRWIFEAF